MTAPSLPDRYRGWSISPPEICPFWTATGPDYDASYEGPEDGWVDNGQKVEARTYKDLLAEIEDFIAATPPLETGAVGTERSGVDPNPADKEPT